MPKFCDNCKCKESDIYIAPIELEIVKSADDDKSKQYQIRGYASIPIKDREEEIVLKDAIDFQEFLDYGYFNYDHKHTPESILGIPSKAFIDNKGFYTEGILFDTPLVRNIVELYETTKKAGVRNLLGMSIEGKILERDMSDPHIIKKVKVRWVAISPKIVNYETTKGFEILAKSIILHQDPRAKESGTATAISKESVEKELKPLDYSKYIKELQLPEINASLPVILNKNSLKSYAYVHLRLNKGLSHDNTMRVLNKLCL